MAGEFEAAGTAIEGALIGAAVEPEHGERGQIGDVVCKNCSATLSGPYCANCGQQAHVHRTFSAIWHDILHSVLHFDGKLWRTLPMLAFKPGELTRRYIHGERAKFVSPMAFFLFSIFLMFAVLSFGGSDKGNTSGWRADMAVEAAKLDTQIAVAAKKLELESNDPATEAKLRAELKELKSDRNGIAFATTGAPIYDDVGARITADGPVKFSTVKAETGWAWFDKKMNDGGKKMVQNPNLAFYKLQSNGYKFAWLLIPLSLPFIWLVTLGVRGHHFYDHAVFTTYSITFICLWFIVVSLLDRTGLDVPVLGVILLLMPPVHLYKQLRHAYGLSRIGTLLRMVPLMLSIVIVMTLFMFILLFLGIM
jgi:Protein of unknown function (DUF3667)